LLPKGEGERILLLETVPLPLSCDKDLGRGGLRAVVLFPFLGGNSGGNSILSKLFIDAADFTVTTLDDDVRESLLDAILCFEGDPGDTFVSLKSSVEMEEDFI